MIRLIYEELRRHSRFTIFGAVTGIVIMALFHRLPSGISLKVFYVLHPAHVFFSAMATASMFRLHKKREHCTPADIAVLMTIGYLGSIGIATVSDSIIPYIGEILLDMPGRKAHIGFIEKWWLVNPLAVAGVIIAYRRPSTGIPHSIHVLLSTWASLFHLLTAVGETVSLLMYAVVFVFLFLSVWLPCCGSDIIFPLLFVGISDRNLRIVSVLSALVFALIVFLLLSSMPAHGFGG